MVYDVAGQRRRGVASVLSYSPFGVFAWSADFDLLIVEALRFRLEGRYSLGSGMAVATTDTPSAAALETLSSQHPGHRALLELAEMEPQFVLFHGSV